MISTIASSSTARQAIHRDMAAELLQSFGELRFVARGASMLPSIFPGDTLLVRRESIENVHSGDVVLCRAGGAFRAHRVQRKVWLEAGWSVFTRGDALCGEDQAVDAGQMLGRVYAVVRRGKRIDLGSPPAGDRLIGWAIKRWDRLAALLLHWHARRSRIAVRSERGRHRRAAGLVELL